MARGNGKAASDAADVVELAVKTLKGDLREAILDRIKHLQKPWEKLGEVAQRELAGDIAYFAETLVRRMGNMIAAEKPAYVECTLKGTTTKDEGLKIQLEASRRHDARYDLLDAIGGTVILTIPNVERFLGQRAPTKIDKDQKPLFDETAAGQATAGTA